MQKKIFLLVAAVWVIFGNICWAADAGRPNLYTVGRDRYELRTDRGIFAFNNWPGMTVRDLLHQIGHGDKVLYFRDYGGAHRVSSNRVLGRDLRSNLYWSLKRALSIELRDKPPRAPKPYLPMPSK